MTYPRYDGLIVAEHLVDPVEGPPFAMNKWSQEPFNSAARGVAFPS